MPQRFLLAALVLLVLGCASSGRLANLTTDNPDGGVYTLFFLKSLLKFESNDVPWPDRKRSYESQLNKVLHGDANTLTCDLVPDSINFGEPGSGGVAQVKCAGQIPFDIDNTVYSMQGKPISRYWIVTGNGI